MTHDGPRPWRALSCATLLVWTVAAHGQRVVDVGDDDSLRAALRAARTGDTIRIAPGVYRGGLNASNLRAAHHHEQSVITITGADPAHPPIIRGGGNGLHLINPANLVVAHLILEGAQHNGLNIDDGGSMNATAERIRIEGVTVRNVGPGGNSDGIKLSGLTRFAVVNCTIERWGDGGSAIDMVGCHHGTIEGCTIRHDPGRGANGVQTKGGSSDIAVTRCRFEHAGQRAINAGGSTGEAFFRPPLAGQGNREAQRITLEQNVIIGSAAAVAFPTSTDCRVTNNVIYRPTRWVLRLLQEQPLDRFVSSGEHTFADNTIIWRRGDLHTIVNVGGNTRPDTLAFARNWWYCEDAPGDSTPSLPVREANGVHGRRPPDEVFTRLAPTASDTPPASGR